MLNPLVNFFAKKMSRFSASLLAILIGVITVLIVIIGVVPIIVEQTQNLITALPRYIEIVKRLFRDVIQTMLMFRWLLNM